MTAVETVSNYDRLVDALTARKAVLGISDETLDDLIGWAPKYTAKLLSPARTKVLGMSSLFNLLGGLGLRLALVEDDEATARIRRHHKFKQRVNTNVRERVAISRLSPRMKTKLMSELGKAGYAASQASQPPGSHRARSVNGGRARWAGVPKRRRREHAIKAAVRRWQKRAGPQPPSPA